MKWSAALITVSFTALYLCYMLCYVENSVKSVLNFTITKQYVSPNYVRRRAFISCSWAAHFRLHFYQKISLQKNDLFFQDCLVLEESTRWWNGWYIMTVIYLKLLSVSEGKTRVSRLKLGPKRPTFIRFRTLNFHTHLMRLHWHNRFSS